MARTVQEQLDAVDLAMKEIEESAQEVSLGNGKSYVLGRYEELRKERRVLQLQVRRTGGRIAIRGARLA